MYHPGDDLFLFSNTLSSDGRTPLTPTKPVGFDIAPGLKPIYHVRIVHAYTPFTMAVVCRVRLIGIFETPMAIPPHIPLPLDTDDSTTTPSPCTDDPETLTNGPEYILKLYDRRCFRNVRKEYGCTAPYSEEHARAYEKYRQGTPAAVFTPYFWDMQGLGDRKDTETLTRLFEAWLEEDARKTYRKELAVYDLLRDLQGKSIPKLFDTVSCNVPFRFARTTSPAAGEERKGQVMDSEHEPDSQGGTNSSDFVDWNIIHGILIEYIPGPSLRSFIRSCMTSPNHRLRSELVSIADEAVAVTVEIGRYPVLNRDIRLDNMLVRESYVSTLDFHTPHDAPVSIETERLVPTASSDSMASKPRRDPRNALDHLNETRCVAIDFGHTRLRFADETDEQWRCAKNADDEEFRITDVIQWEMQVLFKAQRSAQGSSSELVKEANSGDSGESLRRACQIDQQALWNYQPVWLWYRELSPEEYKENFEILDWGQHPNSRD